MADIKKVIDIGVNTKDAKSSVNDLNDSLKNTKKLETEITQESGNMGKGFSSFGDIVDNVSGGAVSSFKGMLSGVRSLSVGFKGLRGAIIATGLGALALVVITVIQYFSKFDAGIKLVSQAMAALTGVVTGIINNFNKLLSGDIIGFFRGVGTEIENNVSAAGRLADALIRLQEIQTTLKTTNAALNVELKQQQLTLSDSTSAYEDRIEAQKEVNRITQELIQNSRLEAEAEREAIQAKIDGASTESELRDAKEEMAAVQAELITLEGNLRLERQKADIELRKIEEDERKRVEAVRNEKIKEAEAKAARTQKEIDDEIKRVENLSKIEQKYLEESENLKAKDASARLELDRQRAKDEIDLLQATQEEKNALLLAMNEKFDLQQQEIEDNKNALELERETARLQNLENLRREIREAIEEENAETEFEKEELKLERERDKLLLELETLEASESEKAAIRDRYAKKIDDAQEKYAESEKKRQKALNKAKVSMVMDAVGAVANALGEESGMSKGVAIAQALWNTYQGISAGVAMGIPAGIPSIVAAGAIGFKSVKDILSTKPEGVKSSGGSGGGAGGGGSPSPSFNVISDNKDTVMDELEAQRSDEPMKAYVVGSEVTTQQALDRNRVKDGKYI